jgi:hypothetical protein
MRIVSLCCALLFLPLHAGGQAALSSAPSKDPSKGTGTVAGQVVRQDTGELLKKRRSPSDRTPGTGFQPSSPLTSKGISPSRYSAWCIQS